MGPRQEKEHTFYEMVGCGPGVALLVRITKYYMSLHSGKDRLEGAPQWYPDLQLEDAPIDLTIPAASASV